MRIVRVRISGWAIQEGDRWLCWSIPPHFGWTEYPELAHVFKRLSEAEAWVLNNSKKD